MLSETKDLVDGLRDCAQQALKISMHIGNVKDESGFLIFESFFNRAADALEAQAAEIKAQRIEIARLTTALEFEAAARYHGEENVGRACCIMQEATKNLIHGAKR
jgi:predicted Zn-dependent peptidase